MTPLQGCIAMRKTGRVSGRNKDNEPLMVVTCSLEVVEIVIGVGADHSMQAREIA